MRLDINLTAKQIEYFDSCARIRNVSTTRMLERLLEVVAEDCLLHSIFDDDSQPWPKISGRRGWYKKRTKTRCSPHS